MSSSLTGCSAVIMMVALTSLAGEVIACSCAAPPDPQQALQEARAVFRGRVTGIKDQEFDTARYGTLHKNIITFEADTVWKGPQQSQVTVETGPDSALCGYPFEVGHNYLVYAGNNYYTHGALETGLCSRTRELVSPGIQEELDALGHGKSVTSH